MSVLLFLAMAFAAFNQLITHLFVRVKKNLSFGCCNGTVQRSGHVCL